MRQIDFPSWALKYKEEHGGILRSRNGRICLYKKTSKRDASSKTPISYEKYLGVLTESHGLIPAKRTLIDVAEMVWAEYGWTRAMLEMCTDSWKKAAGKNWETILHACILHASPNSYLKELYPSGFDKQIETKVKAQITSLYRRIREEYKIDHKDLEILKNLLVICDKQGHYFLTKITDEMNSLSTKLGFDLQVVNPDAIQLKISV